MVKPVRLILGGLLDGGDIAFAGFALPRAGTWHYVNTWEPTDITQISAQ